MAYQERNSKLIGSQFIRRLCERHPTPLTIQEIWDSNLGGLDGDLVAPLPIHYFQHVMRYITQNHDGTFSLTPLGRQHCREPNDHFMLPEHYQPRER